MEDEQYNAISGYLERGVYPVGYKKSQKFVLRRCCKCYKLVNGKLYYKAVDIRPAAGCLIQLLFVWQCSLLSTCTVNIRKYWNLEFFEDFNCLQLYIASRKKKSAQVGFEPGTFIIVTQCLTHQTNLQHTRSAKI